MLSVDERTAFSEMFARLLKVASEQKSIIPKLVDGTWNTSPAKVLDNAIVGYMIGREGVPLPNTVTDPTEA